MAERLPPAGSRLAARSRSDRSGGAGQIAALALAAVAVALLAAWLLAPTDLLAPVPVDAADWFGAAQLERARDFRHGQTLLFLGGLAAQLALIVLLVVGRPRWTRRALERAGRHPLAFGAIAAAGIYLAVQLAVLPFAAVGHLRARDVGLSTQAFLPWLGDLTLSWAIGTLLAAAAGAAVIGLARRFGSRWWIPGSAFVVVAAVALTWLAPTVIAPLFDRYERLQPGQAREDAQRIASRAGIEVGGIYRVDASNRTSGINAFVDGLGGTKRIVLYDTLVDGNGLDRAARRAVIAHEIAHAERNDIPRGLLWVAIAVPLALLAAARLADRLAPGRDSSRGLPVWLPAVALSVMLAATVLQVIGNGLSRAVESRADVRALELTGDPQAMIRLQRALSTRNLGDPSPPTLQSLLLSTHPSTDERIGVALAWERGERP